MSIKIRQETSGDYQAVKGVIQAAFSDEPISDHSEHLLVERLRKSPAFVPELSLVALESGKIVGHILLTRVGIRLDETVSEVLSLAPVSVDPVYQGRGIGGMLINRAHEIARELGFRAVVLIGYENYYPRFGYQPSSKYHITFPFEAPAKNCMVLPLTDQPMEDLQGLVEYPEAFYH